ncbi:MAG: pyrroline-5-carboxylate reductase [Gammaproteobacteria bacterium]|nr:pyrroline-5-carboxylate reductase [Gammaproteobacteria bacterium]
MNRRIAFVGGGNMAYALATRLAHRAYDVVVSEPVAEQRARFDPPVSTTADNTVAVQGASTVVLAVKPQVLESVVREIAPGMSDDQLVLSIAAGVPMTAIETWLGNGRPLVRCMPNTPALVGAGISGLIANAAVTADQRNEAETILRAAGEVVWFDTDTDLDAVTALSGSGPAYFFAVIEALAAAGTNIGLDPETAKRLVVATARGAAIMASDDDPAELRARVTSPGGTTARALSILGERSFHESLDAAVRGAFERSRELAREASDESD